LYGETLEQQWAVLHADDPLELRHVTDILTRVEESFMKLCA
jgi:aspartate aminotransferase